MDEGEIHYIYKVNFKYLANKKKLGLLSIKYKDIKNLEFTEKEIKSALVRFPYSKLAKAFHEIAILRLEQVG
ncbi:MAG: hypothetical protein AAFW70_03120, partial [Cyanobacteria bacterium J06635_10]